MKMRKNHKRKKTASDKKQSIYFKPLIINKVVARQSKDVFNEHIQIIKAAFDSKKDMVLGSVADRKPTINSLRKENGLSEIPDGDVVLTTKNSMATDTKGSSFPLRGDNR